MGTSFRTLAPLALPAVLLCTLAAHQPVSGANPSPKAKSADAASNATPGATSTLTAKDKAAVSPEERTWQELAKPTKIEIIDTPMREVMQFISEQHGMTILFDEAALKEAGVGSETTMTMNLKSASVDSALRLLLRPLKLTHVVTVDGLVTITTAEAARGRLTTRIYAVQDLIATKDDLGEEFLDYQGLIEAISAAISPHGWDTPDPSSFATIVGLNGTLAAHQIQDSHQAIVGLLATLREAKKRQEKTPGGGSIMVCNNKLEEAAYYRIRDALEKPQIFKYDDQRLREIIEFMEKKTGLNFQFDETALKETGISDHDSLNINMRGLPARVALKSLLEPLKCNYIIRDEIVLITTKEVTDGLLETRIYPVADLLQAGELFDEGERRERREDRLTETIGNTVTPELWEARGGSGTIKTHMPSRSLIVTQTAEVHAALEEYLERMRTELREHPPATAPAAPKVMTPDQIVVKVFPLVPSTSGSYIPAADVAQIVKDTVGAKAWQADGLYARPVERVVPAVEGGKDARGATYPSLVVRQTVAVQRNIRRLLKELHVDYVPAEVRTPQRPQ